MRGDHKYYMFQASDEYQWHPFLVEKNETIMSRLSQEIRKVYSLENDQTATHVQLGVFEVSPCQKVVQVVKVDVDMYERLKNGD